MMSAVDELLSLCEQAVREPGHCPNGGIDVGDYMVCLRFSEPTWPVEDKKYRTLDVVKIGWRHYDRPKDRPRRGATFIWDALEEWCKGKGCSLRVECVYQVKLIRYLREERGYKFQDRTDYNLIKVLSSPTN